MKNRIYLLTLIFIMTTSSLSGCKKKETVDLSGIHTSEAETTQEETMSDEKIVLETEPETSRASSGDENGNAVEALSVRSQIATYKDGKISIEYPILSNLRNAETEENINALIKEQAVKIADAYELNSEKDTLSVKCETISLDRSKAVLSFHGELSIDGNSDFTSVFYAMTVDLTKGTLLRLSDYADPYTMAGYIISDDCIVTKAADKESAKEYLKTQELNSMWETLKKCDFSDKDPAFPEAFSYVNNGIIYISIPAPHELGDHILIEYHTETK